MKIKILSYIILIFILSSCEFGKRQVNKAKDKVGVTIEYILESTIGSYLDLPDRSINRNINKSELFGKWIITSSSKNRIKTFQKANPHWYGISFPADSFQLDPNQISVVFNSGLMSPSDAELLLESKKDIDTPIIGEWKVEIDSINIKGINKPLYKVIAKLEFPKNYDHYYSFKVYEEKGDLILWDYIGDPDDWKFQEFIKN